MLRLGLCCKFYEEPIKFREMRYIHYEKMEPQVRTEKIDQIIVDNIDALESALAFCAHQKIGAFRIASALFPIYTHPQVEYSIDQLPSSDKILAGLNRVALYAEKNRIRLSFHPDQFVILNSPRDEVVEAAIRDLEYHNFVADLVGADVINIHAGGIYGDKTVALKRFEKNFARLSKKVQEKLTIENDDKSYTPQDLYPLCQDLNIPLVYDVHHHRCLPDSWGEAQATEMALKTWNREPLFHISSPKEGWDGPKPARHHDFIDIKDFPEIWKEIRPLTVDIEAKAKEKAILKLMEELNFSF